MLTLSKSKLKSRLGIAGLPRNIDDLSRWPNAAHGSPDRLYECEEVSSDLTDAMGGEDLPVLIVAGSGDSPSVAMAGFGLARDHVVGANRYVFRGATPMVLDGGFGLICAVEFTATSTNKVIASVSDMTNASPAAPVIDLLLRTNGSGQFEIGRRRAGGSISETDYVADTSFTPTTGVVYQVIAWHDHAQSQIGLRIDGRDPVTKDDAVLGPTDANFELVVGGGRNSGALGSSSNSFLGNTGRLAFWDQIPPWYLRYAGLDRATARSRYAADCISAHFVGDSLTLSALVAPGSRFAETVSTALGLRMVGHAFPGASAETIFGWLERVPPEALKGELGVVFTGNHLLPSVAENIDYTQRIVGRLRKAGCKRVLILGAPNRRGFATAQVDIDADQVFLDQYNASMLATFGDDFGDLHDEFINDTNGHWTAAGGDADGDDTADRTTRGIVPRSARDVPTSGSATHFGIKGDLVVQLLIDRLLA